MEYVVKPKNKFPYICYISTPPKRCYDEINPWVKENIGAYNKKWYCPKQTTEYFIYYPYAFKHKEDAMAFKLRWSK